MKFKRNVTATFACVLSEACVSMAPGTVMMTLVMDPERLSWGDLKEIFLSVLGCIIIVNLFMFAIACIARIFIKDYVKLNPDHILSVHRGQQTVIPYDSVAGIIYDLGDLPSRMGSWNQSEVILRDIEGKMLLALTNPSIVLVMAIRSRCKNHKMHYINKKRFLWIFLISIGVSILVPLLAYWFG